VRNGVCILGGAAQDEDARADLEARIKAHTIRTALILLFLGYPALSSQMLAVFNCRSLHSGLYVMDNVATVCNTSEHTLYRFVATAGVVLYAAGIPLGFLALMRYYGIPKLARHKQDVQVRPLATRQVQPVASGSAHPHKRGRLLRNIGQ